MANCLSIQIAMSRHSESPSDTFEKFSPLFIYNQINHGQDNGSYIYHESEPNAIQLVEKVGCCTQATMPNTQNTQARISPASLTEASVYRALGHCTCNSLQEIKIALTLNYPLLIAIRVDDGFAFFKRGDGVYHYTGETDKQQKLFPNEQIPDGGGLHAICVTAYDDKRGPNGAVRLLNSWGRGDAWGEDGAIWVDYSEFKAIGEARSFCTEVHLINATNLTLPQYDFVSNAEQGFVLSDSGSITDHSTGKLVSNGSAIQLSATDNFLFWLTKNKGVSVLARYAVGQGLKERPEDITELLGANNVKMLASAKNEVLALTNNGIPWQRQSPPEYNIRRWVKKKPAAMEEQGQRGVDLRKKEDTSRIFLTTDDGAVYEWDSNLKEFVTLKN
jgi:hypothetical protein